MSDFATISGRLWASFFDAQAAPVPLTGHVVFTPRFTTEKREEGLHLPTQVVARLDEEGRFEARLLAGAWSWTAQVDVKHQGVRVPVPCFDFVAVAGATLDFKELAPVSPIAQAQAPVSPVVGGPSQPAAPGPPGVGISRITLEDDALVFTLTNGATQRVPAPKGTPGRDAPAPTLAIGEVSTGEPVAAVVRGEAPDFLLDLTLPPGAPGKPGQDGKPGRQGPTGPAPSLTIGQVTTGEAAASITGADGAYQLNLTIPAGGGGPDAPAEAQDTGWRDVTALLGAGWEGTFASSVFLRRIGSICFLNFSVKPPSGGAVTMLKMPDGFKSIKGPFQGGPAAVLQRDGVVNGTIYFDSPATIKGRSAMSAAHHRGGMTWPTEDPWPTDLPGTPA